MGRPPIGKKAMTDAQRQQRRRRLLKRQKKAAEREQKQAENLAKLRRDRLTSGWGLNAQDAAASERLSSQAVDPPLTDPAEELVEQVLEAIQLEPDFTLADVYAAMGRRLPAT